MNQMDQHISAVRRRMATSQFIDTLSKGLLLVAMAAIVAVVVHIFFAVYPPKPMWCLIGAVGVAMLVAMVHMMMRGPGDKAAAIAIDEKLNLKEVYSTALYVRDEKDAFAKAAVLEAASASANVSVQKRFPVVFPRRLANVVAIGTIALLGAWLIPTVDLFSGSTAQANEQDELQNPQQAKEAQKIIETALAQVNAVPKELADGEKIQNAKRELEHLLANPPKDAQKAHQSAMKALQDAQDSIKKQIENNQKFANAKTQERLFQQNMNVGADEKGPVADARREMAKGDYDQAMADIKKAVDNFDKMDDQQKKDAAKQMEKMAQQLADAASNPAAQQKIQDQLQRMGATQQQAQQMQQAMQAAAQGNPAAAQQLQQQANKLAQQLNNGQGPTAAQQQQISQMVQSMQAQTNTQQQAAQLSQSAQQMASAMSAACQNPSASQSGSPGASQQGASQQAAGQMASAQQAMQQQMGAMQAIQNDVKQMAASQQAMSNATGQQANAMGGQGQGKGQGQGQGQAQGQGQGQGQGGQGQGQGNSQWAAGNPSGKGSGQGGPGVSSGGGGIGAAQAPFSVKEEFAPSQNNEQGQLLANLLVKDPEMQKGESRQQLKEIVEASQHEAVDEVDQDYVSHQNQAAVREYFNSLGKDASPASSNEPANP